MSKDCQSGVRVGCCAALVIAMKLTSSAVPEEVHYFQGEAKIVGVAAACV